MPFLVLHSCALPPALYGVLPVFSGKKGAAGSTDAPPGKIIATLPAYISLTADAGNARPQRKDLGFTATRLLGLLIPWHRKRTVDAILFLSKLPLGLLLIPRRKTTLQLVPLGKDLAALQGTHGFDIKWNRHIWQSAIMANP